MKHLFMLLTNELVQLFTGDLKALCESFGIRKRDAELEEMLDEVAGPVTQAKFTTLLASRAGDVDDAQVLQHETIK